MDLLTTYTHHSELQVLTALLLIFTLYKSPQHPLTLSPACCAFIIRYPTKISNSGDSSASRALFLPSQPPVQNSYQLSTELLLHFYYFAYCHNYAYCYGYCYHYNVQYYRLLSLLWRLLWKLSLLC
jgi:hypothetical protein